MKVVDKPREIALQIIHDINEKGAYTNIAVNRYLEAGEFRELDRAFITDLVYGTVKWKQTLDWMISRFSSVKLKKISPWIMNILRLGVYQIHFMDKIPVSAACNESVKLSRKYGHAASAGFVNGVLRSIARAGKEMEYPDRRKDFTEYLAVRYSHPVWMVERFLQLFGADFTESLLDSNNKIPDFILRVNTMKLSREELIQALGEAGIEALPGKHLEESVILRNPSSVTRLEAFKNGWFQVQDESSMLVARVLDPKPEEWVVDVCSAPGGKATHIAQLMKDKGTVIARDIHAHKLDLIDEAVKRLQLHCVKTELFDATVTDPELKEKADRVLVDAPCTGLGIIRRKPDIKWVRNTDDAEEIKRLQKRILKAASSYVKPGGVLVYSTCTILPEENKEVVEEFVATHDEFVFEDPTSYLPSTLVTEPGKKNYIQLYPNVHGTDGFFIARMRRKS